MSKSTQTTPKFTNSPAFQKQLKNRVHKKFSKNQKRDRPEHYFKGAIFMLAALSSYAALYFTNASELLVLLCIVSAVTHTAVGFNIFHDAIHGSLSNSKKVNKTFAFITCSILGVSHKLWRHKHNYLHHQFPNVEEWDDDLETREALKLAPGQKNKWRYQFQHLYAPLVYSLTTIEWVFIKDFKQYFTGKMNPTQSIPRFSPWDHAEFWLAKFIYMMIYFVLPLTYFSLGTFLVGFLLFHLTHSLVLASIFQLAHVMPGKEFPNPSAKKGNMERDISQVQIETTTNFATNSKLLYWFAGGLNYQIEHHLFPQISHIHYPEISHTVKEICQEFGIHYSEFPTYTEALTGHLKTLKHLGQKSTQPTS